MIYIPHLPVLSPKLIEFQRAYEESADKPSMVAAFWKDVEACGTPLIETLDGHSNDYLVTFLFQEERLTAELSVSCQIFGSIPSRGNMTLLIPGTDIYFRSVFMKKQTRTIYFFSRGMTKPPELPSREAPPRPILDPFNPEQIDLGPPFGSMSVLQMPDAPAQPWRAIDASVPQGAMSEIVLPKGARKPAPWTDDEEKASGDDDDQEEAGFIIHIYVPPGFSDNGDRYHLGIFFDGRPGEERAKSSLNRPNLLNKLIAAKRVPPMVCAMVQPNNRVNELRGQPGFVDLLVNHLIPELRTEYHGTSDPHQTVVGGISLGGLMSMYMGLHHPDIFGKVLCQSGSFWSDPYKEGEPTSMLRVALPDEEREYQFLIRQCIDMDPVDIQIYMEIGTYEGFESLFGVPSHHYASHWMRDVLRLKGYDVEFSEYRGAHDYVTWRETWAEAMIHLFKEWSRENA